MNLRNKWLSPVRALLVVTLWAALLIWGVAVVNRMELTRDVSGMALGETRYLLAEIAPDTRLTVVGASRLLPLLDLFTVPGGPLRVVRVPPDPQTEGVRADEDSPHLEEGDVLVQSGPSWLLLRNPGFESVMAAVARVSAPDRPVPAAAAPVPAGGIPVQEDAGILQMLRTGGAPGVLGLLAALGAAALGLRLRRVRSGS